MITDVDVGNQGDLGRSLSLPTAPHLFAESLKYRSQLFEFASLKGPLHISLKGSNHGNLDGNAVLLWRRGPGPPKAAVQSTTTQNNASVGVVCGWQWGATICLVSSVSTYDPA